MREGKETGKEEGWSGRKGEEKKKRRRRKENETEGEKTRGGRKTAEEEIGRGREERRFRHAVSQPRKLSW